MPSGVLWVIRVWFCRALNVEEEAEELMFEDSDEAQPSTADLYDMRSVQLIKIKESWNMIEISKADIIHKGVKNVYCCSCRANHVW